MTDHNQQNDQKGGVNPVAAAVVGAVVGAAAVGVAGVAAMANDDSRKKVEKVIAKAKDNAADIKSDMEDKLAEGKEKVKKVTVSAKDALHSEFKDAKKTMQTK